MDWRNSRGGPTEEEIRKIAAKSPVKYSDDVIAKTLLSKRKEACRGLVVAFEERLQEKQNCSASELSKLRPRLVYVHEVLPPEMVRDIASVYLDSQLAGSISENSIRESFRMLNERSSADKRLEYLTSLEQPIGVDVYLVKRKAV